MATFKSRFPAFSGMSIDQQKVILAACKNPEEAKELLAKLLLPLVISLEPEYAGQVVSMFLELDHKNICELIQSPPMLSSKVAEAMEVLSPNPPSRVASSSAPRNVHFAPVPSTESPSPSSPALAPPPGLGHLQEVSRESYANATRTLASRFQAILSAETVEPSSTYRGKERMSAAPMDADPSFLTPVNSSYEPYVTAGNKRKGWGPSSDLSPGASSSGAAADPRQVLAAAGPVGADLVPGQYVQVSSNTNKSSYKNRIFRVLTVHAKASDLEYLDDEEQYRPSVRNHLLLVPGPSAINLNEYQNIKVQRPSDPFWTHVASASADPSETSSTGAVTGVPHPLSSLASFDATITRPRSATPETLVPARVLQHPAGAPPVAPSSQSAGAQGAVRKPVKPRGDPLVIKRNQDYRFMGVQICTLRKDPITKLPRKYWYTIVGVETGQWHAYSLEDEYGKRGTSTATPGSCWNQET